MWLQAARLRSLEPTSSVTILKPGKYRLPNWVEIATSAAHGRGRYDTSNAGDVVPGIKGEPAPLQKHLEPGAEIHRRGVLRNTNVAQVARAISGRNVHATAERDRKMGKIAANPDALFVALRRGSIAAGMMIAELDAAVHVIADGLYALPAAGDRPEQRPGKILSFWVSQYRLP